MYSKAAGRSTFTGLHRSPLRRPGRGRSKFAGTIPILNAEERVCPGCFFAARSRKSFADNPAALGTSTRAAGLRPLVGRCVLTCTRMASLGGSNSQPLTRPLPRILPFEIRVPLRPKPICSEFSRHLAAQSCSARTPKTSGWKVRSVATARVAYSRSLFVRRAPRKIRPRQAPV